MEAGFRLNHIIVKINPLVWHITPMLQQGMNPTKLRHFLTENNGFDKTIDFLCFKLIFTYKYYE